MSYRKPFCKICFDAKKPESQYTSHYIRATNDPNSAVTCPVLLATECRYCHKMGHTIQHCAERNRNNERKQQAIAPKPIVSSKPIVTSKPVEVAQPKKTSTNKFALLDSDDEEEVTKEPVKAPMKAPVQAPIKAPIKAPINAAFPSLPAFIPRPQNIVLCDPGNIVSVFGTKPKPLVFKPVEIPKHKPSYFEICEKKRLDRTIQMYMKNGTARFALDSEVW